MKTMGYVIILGALLLTSVATPIATAQDRFVVYDRERGELSPGAEAPSRREMLQAIETAAPTRLIAVLEYGERVECHECVAPLQRKMLESNDARVRQIAAWWLRRRLFGYGAILASLRTTLADDADAVRRGRAADALGEFMDPTNVAPLRAQLAREATPDVRASIVRAAARINVPIGHDIIAAGLADSDPAVRNAALSVVTRVNFFTQFDALVPLLADADPAARRRAALAVGQYRVVEAVAALAGLLRGDENVHVRQAAAWALGRIGGAEASAALGEAATTERESLVVDAIDVARRM